MLLGGIGVRRASVRGVTPQTSDIALGSPRPRFSRKYRLPFALCDLPPQGSDQVVGHFKGMLDGYLQKYEDEEARFARVDESMQGVVQVYHTQYARKSLRAPAYARMYVATCTRVHGHVRTCFVLHGHIDVYDMICCVCCILYPANYAGHAV